MVMEIACPACGTNPSFVYNDSDVEMFLCHGCQRNSKWEYIQNAFSTNNVSDSNGNRIHIKVTANHNSLLSDCQRIVDLDSTHPGFQFIRDRRIPLCYRDLFYYTENLGTLVNSYGYNFKDSQAKVIIPFFDENEKLFALQARALDNTLPKYITILLEKDKGKIFGLERWNKDETTYLVEGPIDSLFLPNALAMAGSDISENKYSNSDMIVCLDNEQRNAEIISKYSKFIDRGFKIVIWPDNLRSKDINDMILENLNPLQIIQENTHQGLAAKIKLDNWKRI